MASNMSSQSTDDRGAGGWLGWAQIGLVLLVIVIALFFARAPSVESRGEVEAFGSGKPEVSVLAPSAGSHALTVSLTGEVRIEVVVPLQIEAAGRIVSVSPNLKEGGAFSAGEVLVTLESDDYERQLERAEAILRTNQARLEKQQLQGARDSAQFQRENPGADVPPLVARLPQIARRQGRVDASVTWVEDAREELADTELAMPFDGRIVLASAAVGQLAAPGRALGSVYSRDSIEVQVPIPADDLAYLEPAVGRSAEIMVNGSTYVGAVARVSNVVNRRSRQSTLFLRFADDEPLAELPSPGTFVEVEISGPTLDDAFQLPEEVERVGGTLWLVDNGTLTRVEPTQLGRTGESWLVEAFDFLDGIAIGPIPGAREGLEVEIVDSE